MRKTLITMASVGAIAAAALVPVPASAYPAWVIPAIVGAGIGGVAIGAVAASAATTPQSYATPVVSTAYAPVASGYAGGVGAACRPARMMVDGGWRRVTICE